LVIVSACKQLQENQAIAWISKTKEKNPPKQERLVFLETTVDRVGETAENQRKTREKTKVLENHVFWLDFCAKKRTVHYLSGRILLASLKDVYLVQNPGLLRPWTNN
jgi:hypothetical protein